MVNKSNNPDKQSKKHLVFSLIIMLFLVQSCAVFAQTPSYPIKKINGVECIVYKVKPAEGFYRISKNFNTTEAVIREFNPQIKDGLKANMEIYIPMQQPTAVKSAPATNNTQDFIEHVVDKQQTIYRITKIYDISEQELLQANPQVKNYLIHPGDVLRIPVKQKASASASAPTQTAVAGIPSKQPEQAEQANFPPKDIQKSEATTQEEGSAATTTEASDSLIQRLREKVAEIQEQIEQALKGKDFNENQDATDEIISPQDLKIVFLLPYLLDNKQENVDRRFIEFYAGALVAINNAKLQGHKLEIYNFDVEKSDVKIMEVLRDSLPANVDFIVGPAYANQIPIVGDYARNNKVKALIPFASKILDIASNPYIYQFNPGQELEIAAITEIVDNKESTTNIVFADHMQISSNDEGLQLSNKLKSNFNNANIAYNSLTLHLDSMEHLWEALDPWKENIIFFNSAKISHSSLYLQELNRLSDFVKVKVYEPFAWRSSSINRPPSFYISVFKNEYPELEYDLYSKHFASLFNWSATSDLPRYDLLGYDLMSCFIQHITSSKNQLPESYPMYNGIQSDIQFERVSSKGGYLNHVLIHYE